MFDQNVSQIGDKNGEHWAISAQVVAVKEDNGDMNMYSSKNIGKMEKILAIRSFSSQHGVVKSSKVRVEAIRGNNGNSWCSLNDTASTTSDSGGTFSSGPVESGHGKSTMGAQSSPIFSNVI